MFMSLKCRWSGVCSPKQLTSCRHRGENCVALQVPVRWILTLLGPSGPCSVVRAHLSGNVMAVWQAPLEEDEHHC